MNIADLTGIEAFTALTHLYCMDNYLTSLDLSNNTALTNLKCNNNQLTNLDVRNGNNTNVFQFQSVSNAYLTCINVDDSAWASNHWTVLQNIDAQHYFSNNCSGTTGIEGHTTNKKILKVTDLLGRETKQTNKPLFYIFDDGTVEKRIVIE